LIRVENRPPQNEFRNIWFRNNIFWENTGGVTFATGIDPKEIHFVNNLWSKPYDGDAQAKTGDPLFVEPNAHTAKGYLIQSGSAARDQGMLLYENPMDFWNGPHLSETEKYDIGAHEFDTIGVVHIGLDMVAFPFEVPPFKLQFKARPKR
jgi:hypothetical protein